MVKLPVGIGLNNLISFLKIVSWEAADILLDYSSLMKNQKNNDDFITLKKDASPVTIADLKVNDLVINKLQEKYGNEIWNYLSEENAKFVSKQNGTNSEWLWILDPLDGTKDFIQGTEDYAMHLALNYQNKPILGVVLIPKRDELWISDGMKVWGERSNGKIVKSNLSSNRNLNEMTLVRSKNHSNERLKVLIEKINFKNTIVMGSIGCKISSIIRGESDIYISLSMPEKSAPKDWDFAAPDSILKAAGGAITNLDNQELSYGKNSFEQRGIIVATNNRKTHGSICLEIKKIIENNKIYPL